jgi:hypothetical protein
MHDCQRFREELLGLISDSQPEALSPGCVPCRQYAREAAALFAHLESLRSDVPNLPPDYWAGFNNRLKQALIEDASACVQFSGRWERTFGIVLACTAALVIAVCTLAWRATHVVLDPRTAGAAASSPLAAKPAEIRVVDDHVEGLDQDMIHFFSQSEMFLRAFTRISPSDIEDIEDARTRAAEQLAGLEERKRAAEDFVPVQIVLDEYQNVLRDIENLQSSESIADDIADIQGKIRQNGLVAGMKTYQPRVELLFVSGR